MELVDPQLTEDCCEDLAYVITTTKHLKSLDLEIWARKLARQEKASNNMNSITRIQMAEGKNELLGACELTSNCCEALSLALSRNTHLNSLNLVKNDFSTSGMLRLCSAFHSPDSNLWIIGLWKQQYYAQVRRQLEELQFIKPHVVINGDWYAIDEDDRNWWKN
ncbi:NACHT, LRR and PYD domains-containing protein 5 [Apodemus speciosus]|uniref:NACHT, LRR and PYD domains-containing protein 5 n=1 Tax=Apodemus speciosus TaxID=105296 RepID=A0ABQ0EXA9_APOSI